MWALSASQGKSPFVAPNVGMAMIENSQDGDAKRQGMALGTQEAGFAAAASGGLTDNTLQLLHSLGYIYGAFGQTKRALVLQLIAVRIAPDNTALLRTLAYTFLRDGAPERTLAVLERLRSLGDDDPALDVLTSRALWAVGREDEAKHIFKEFLDRREQV